MTSLLRSTRTMALGTVASRATGFLRTAVLAAALGGGPVGNAFNVANTAPNIVYDLLLGGILSSVIVPLLVRALREGAAQGHEYTQRLLGLTLAGLGSVVAVLVVAAPLVLRVYLPPSAPYFHLTVVFAVFFFPQVLFYGLGAVLGAYLNAQGRFGPPMWAPVLNNVVVIATGLLFLLLPSPHLFTAQTITDTQVAVIGVGVTLGVLAQTVALVPSLRATGLSLRPRFDFRGTGLGPAAQLARWTLLYVVANQVVLVVVIQLANSVRPGHGATYSYFVFAYLLWQLPHAVVAVSIITALLPEMSRAAADDRLDELRRQLDRGLRLTVSVLVPASVAYVVLGHPIATLVFAHGRTDAAGARDVGTLLVLFTLGLLAFSAYQLQLRAFYALQDTRTPALVNLAVNATTVVADVLLFLLLPERDRVLGLAAGQSA
ncbi:MAG: murein biosynthesis integral membrane protein MurJ, partial [Mycobacteriales bacterium]